MVDSTTVFQAGRPQEVATYLRLAIYLLYRSMNPEVGIGSSDSRSKDFPRAQLSERNCDRIARECPHADMCRNSDLL